MNENELIRQELIEAKDLLEKIITNEDIIKQIEDAAQLIVDAINDGKKIIACGNGGSHCDAMHFAEELSGRFREDRRALPAIAISDPAHISCTANDYGFDFIYSRYIEALGNSGDVLLSISTSGNSTNILEAIKAAHKLGIKVIALTGKDGGKVAPIADINIQVPHFGFADRIQEIHIKIIHILILLIERKLIHVS